MTGIRASEPEASKPKRKLTPSEDAMLSARHASLRDERGLKFRSPYYALAIALATEILLDAKKFAAMQMVMEGEHRYAEQIRSADFGQMPRGANFMIDNPEPTAAPTNEDEVVLFMTNGDETFNCAWCEGRFPVDVAIPDDNDEPICPECHQGALNDDILDESSAVDMLGRVSFYLAAEYPYIKQDVHRSSPERRACEIILACKDLIDLTSPQPSTNLRRNRL